MWIAVRHRDVVWISRAFRDAGYPVPSRGTLIKRGRYKATGRRGRHLIWVDSDRRGRDS